MYYKYKTNKIMFRVREKIINIPSRMYPLESPGYTLFTPSTTVPIEDDHIEEIFDSLEFEMGRCFKNSSCQTTSNAFLAKSMTCMCM